MTYGTEITEHDLGRWGKLKFVQWLHPCEQRKEFCEADVDWLARFIPKGGIAMDIGAYTGDTAIVMAVAAGKHGMVLAYEPNPKSREVLLKNFVLSQFNPDLASILVSGFAIMPEESDTVTFGYTNEFCNGGFGIQGDGITAPTKRLSKVLQAATPMPPIAYIKIDTEGMDGKILAEATEELRKHKSVVCLERYPDLSREDCDQLWKAITDYGTPSMNRDETFTPLTSLPAGLCDILVRPHV